MHKMGIRWRQALPLLMVAFILYVLCVYFMVGCSHDKTFANGDPLTPKPVVREVVEPDMPQWHQENP